MSRDGHSLGAAERRSKMNLLRTGLAVAGFIVIGAGHAVADGCPRGTVPYRETTEGNGIIVHCRCSQSGLVYYNNKCRAEHEAEGLLMNKIRNAAEGANRAMQTWACERPIAERNMLQSHVKTASAALFLAAVTENPAPILTEGFHLAIDRIELDVQAVTCTTNEDVRVACQNFKVFLKTVKDARRELASIRKPEASIGPAEPTIGPLPPRDVSMWADPSDPNLDAFCQPLLRVRP
jgi:hypothetical protein